MNKNSLILYLIILLSSCVQNSQDSGRNDNASLSNPIIEKFSTTAEMDLNESDFNAFWKTFRNAILKNDIGRVTALTRFPFKTRGPMDSDETICYQRAEFEKVFKAFLNQDQGIKTEIEVIKEIVVPNTDNITCEWARIGNMEFDKVEGKWRLTFVYLEYPTIEELKR